MGLSLVRVNGVDLPLVADEWEHRNALDWLRAHGLTGAKEGCAEGECGACAVLVARPAASLGGRDGPAVRPTEWVAVNSCLVPTAGLCGQELVTAEGLGAPGALHPVQQALVDLGGSQCGYCTPGFVCSMAAEYYRREPVDGAHPATDRFDEQALSGNLCRCTGYRPIRDAARRLGRPAADDPLATRLTARPPEWEAVVSRGFIRPAGLAETIDLLESRPDAVPVAGATDLGVEINLRGLRPATLVAIDRLPELRGLRIDDERIEIGAALTLTEVQRGLSGRIPLLDALVPQFASRLVRNVATLGGNLVTASPIGDAAPALLALEASLVVVGPDGERVVPLVDFFTGYRRTQLYAAELVRSVTIPLPLRRVTAFHKIAKRRTDDISGVAIAWALDVDGGVVTGARIGIGGVAATPLRARSAEDELVGRPWTGETARALGEVLAAEGTPIDDVRASAAYRRSMLTMSALRLHAETTLSKAAP